MIIQKIAKLISVKTFVTFAIVGVFCTLAIKGSIDSQSVMTIASTVIAFYFGTQHEKGNGNGS